MASSSGPFLAPAIALSLTAAVLLADPVLLATEQKEGRGWVGTWAASPQAVADPLPINGQTLRQIVHTSIGGDTVRIRLSNAYGTGDVVVGTASVALSAGGAATVDGTTRGLRFSGSPSITISPGALVVSDPVRLSVPALGDVAVSVYFPGDVAATTRHDIGLQTNYLSPPGDFTAANDFTGTTTQSYHFLTAVEVHASNKSRALVTLGDSVTDGFASTPDENQRWPNLLAERLQSHERTSDVAVLNAGVSGNRMLYDLVGTGSLSRLDRDVLVQTGAAYLIVLQGNADILIPDLIGNPTQNVSAEQIIQGHRQIIDRARAMGLRVYGGTLNPVEGFPFPGFWTTVMEAKRQAVNHWIRTSRAYDAVIDFDRVLRDPANPSRMRPEYSSGDGVHPNDLGYRAMADAIPLSLFRDRETD
jgi:lysophospholipase L1-like esterase